MKRVVLFFLAAVLAITLVGCGDPKPDDKFSADTVAALEAAIETLDAVLAYDMSMEDAAEKLERICSTMDDSDTYGSIASTYISTSRINLSLISRYADYSSKFGSSSDYDAGDMKDIKEDRDKLYDLLYGN